MDTVAFMKFFHEFNLWHNSSSDSLKILNIFLCSSPGSEERGRTRTIKHPMFKQELAPHWELPKSMSVPKERYKLGKMQLYLLRKLFADFDVDKSGFLDEAEVNLFSQRLDQELVQQQHGNRAALLGYGSRTTDGSRNDAREKSTVHAGMKRWAGKKDQGKNTGTAATLPAMFFLHGEGNTGGELLRMIQAMDKDGDGKISYEEMEWAVTRHYEMNEWVHSTTVNLPEFVHAMFMFGILCRKGSNFSSHFGDGDGSAYEAVLDLMKEMSAVYGDKFEGDPWDITETGDDHVHTNATVHIEAGLREVLGHLFDQYVVLESSASVFASLAVTNMHQCSKTLPTRPGARANHTAEASSSRRLKSIGRAQFSRFARDSGLCPRSLRRSPDLAVAVFDVITASNMTDAVFNWEESHGGFHAATSMPFDEFVEGTELLMREEYALQNSGDDSQYYHSATHTLTLDTLRLADIAVRAGAGGQLLEDMRLTNRGVVVAQATVLLRKVFTRYRSPVRSRFGSLVLREEVNIRARNKIVRVFGGTSAALDSRTAMPIAHRPVVDWTDDDWHAWASNCGVCAEATVKWLFDSPDYAEVKENDTLRHIRRKQTTLRRGAAADLAQWVMRPALSQSEVKRFAGTVLGSGKEVTPMARSRMFDVLQHLRASDRRHHVGVVGDDADAAITDSDMRSSSEDTASDGQILFQLGLGSDSAPGVKRNHPRRAHSTPQPPPSDGARIARSRTTVVPPFAQGRQLRNATKSADHAGSSMTAPLEEEPKLFQREGGRVGYVTDFYTQAMKELPNNDALRESALIHDASLQDESVHIEGPETAGRQYTGARRSSTNRATGSRFAPARQKLT